MKYSSLSLVVGLSALSLVGFGCNPMQSVQDKVSQKIGDSVASGILSKASGGKVDVNSDSGAYTFKDNKTGASLSIGENVSIPDTLPKDIPLYPDAKTLTVSVGQGGKGESSITQTSKDEPQAVIKWYADKLKDWKEASSYSMGGSEMRAYEKDKLKMNVTVMPGSDENKGSVMTIVRSDTSVEETQE